MAEITAEMAPLEALKYLAQKSMNEFAAKTTVNTLSQKVDEIEVPTKLSDLENDEEFQTEDDVSKAVTAGINKFATELSENGKVDTFAELVNYVAEHGTQVTGMLSDINENKESIQQVEEKLEGIKVADVDQVKSAIDKIFAGEE